MASRVSVARLVSVLTEVAVFGIPKAPVEQDDEWEQEAKEDQEATAVETTNGQSFVNLVTQADVEAVGKVEAEMEAGAAATEVVMTTKMAMRATAEKDVVGAAGGGTRRGAMTTTTRRLASNHCPSNK